MKVDIPMNEKGESAPFHLRDVQRIGSMMGNHVPIAVPRVLHTDGNQANVQADRMRERIGSPI